MDEAALLTGAAGAAGLITAWRGRGAEVEDILDGEGDGGRGEGEWGHMGTEW